MRDIYSVCSDSLDGKNAVARPVFVAIIPPPFQLVGEGGTTSTKPMMKNL